MRCRSDFKKFGGNCNVIPKNQTLSVDINTPELVTSDWYKRNKHKMWTQHFVYFCREKQLYNLYRHTPPSLNKAFAAHWKEKGAHFDGTHSSKKDRALLQVEDVISTAGGPSIMDFPPSSTLPRYDFGANLVTMVDHLDPAASSGELQFLPPVVMSAAIGYSLEDFENFVGSLREHYFGDVWLLISKDSSSTGDGEEIRRYLSMNNVEYLETDGGQPGGFRKGRDWEAINRDRFQFFSSVCDPNVYSLCLTTDFRDSIFQSNPFSNIDRLLLPPQPSAGVAPIGILHVFEHNKAMSVWHYDKMKDRRCKLFEEYGHFLNGTNIINGGSIIGSPWAFKRLEVFMTDKWKGCNDQVILNVLVRSKTLSLESNTKTDGTILENHNRIVVEVHRQGHGPLNVLGHNGLVLKGNGGRFLNRNCIVAPAVHQYDLVKCPKK